MSNVDIIKTSHCSQDDNIFKTEKNLKHHENFINGYECTKILGTGKYGIVYLGTKNDKNYVLKFVKTKYFDTNELDIFKKVSDLCMSKGQYIEDFVYKNHTVIVSDYINDSIDLFDYIYRIHNTTFRKKHSITEYIIQYNITIITKFLLEQLICMHDNNIVHMDIKPENILIQVNKQFMITYVTFIDFGFSCTKDIFKDGSLHYASGTLEYMAPELINQHCRVLMENNTTLFFKPITLNDYKKTDIWSLGVTLFLLITNYFPYELFSYKSIPSQYDICHSIIYTYKNFPDSDITILHNISPEISVVYKEFYKGMQHLISQMLKYNSKQRIDAKTLMQYL